MNAYVAPRSQSRAKSSRPVLWVLVLITVILQPPQLIVTRVLSRRYPESMTRQGGDPNPGLASETESSSWQLGKRICIYLSRCKMVMAI